MTSNTPLTIGVTRGDNVVESRHHVHAVLMDGQGKIKEVYGDAKLLTFPRSTLKPLQAIPLIESGAADNFKLTDAEIALAAASHSGEEKHTSAVNNWLERIGLEAGWLECGPHAPYSAPNQPVSTLANNCSGKHAGMISIAWFLKIPVNGYTKPAHAVQQRILATLTEMCGSELTPAICGIDGCSAPNPAMPLENLARGFAAFMQQQKPAHQRIFQAMTQHPDLVGGKGRLDTVLMQAAQGKIVSKTGAEGVYIAVIPGQDTVIALKAEDGASRAAQAALYGLLEKHQLADSTVLDAIRPLALPVLKNWRSLETGKVVIL